MAVEQWQVYYVPNCRHAKPVPKNKFVAVACFDSSIPHGFFINSRIRGFIQRRSWLQSCEVRILVREHLFLSHDSWVDCTSIYPFTASELNDYRGNLSTTAVAEVLKGVVACPVLALRYKDIIQSQHAASSSEE